MTVRILLTGKNGQVGSELARLLAPVADLTALGRRELDLAKPDDIRRAIAEARPELIINAAAYTAVDQAEKEESLARAVNADAPGLLAEEAKRIGAFVIHYSTDYVFDGAKRSPYIENDPTNPLGAYGRTKLAGEEAIRRSGVPHLIFRTAWVYGTSGKNFLLTILRLASTREELRIVNDQFGAPTPARAIAVATARIIRVSRAALPADTKTGGETPALQHTSPGGGAAETAALLARSAGTYHLTSAGETTWHEFAAAICDAAHTLIPSDAPQKAPAWAAAATAGQPIICRRVIPITTAEYPTPARRPAYSVLSNAKFASTFGFSLSDWRSELAETIQSHG
jgi:dTDP-4-dehydrorhamnose reductase